MKILFLDFDGVLNSIDNMEANHFLWKNNPQHKSKDFFGDLFDQRCINWLHYIILKTNCKLVISSTWRVIGLNNIKNMWKARDLPGEIYSSTPVLSNAHRGNEIAEWLSKNEYITSYCIVDDENDMIENQSFVQTDPIYGLNKGSSSQIITILNK